MDAPIFQATPQRVQPSDTARLVPYLYESSTRVLHMQLSLRHCPGIAKPHENKLCRAPDSAC